MPQAIACNGPGVPDAPSLRSFRVREWRPWPQPAAEAQEETRQRLKGLDNPALSTMRECLCEH